MLYTVIIRRPNETTGLPGLRTLLQLMNETRRRMNERTNAGTSSPPPITAGSPSITPGGVSASLCVKIRWRTWQHQKEYISAVKYRLAVYHLPSDQRKLVRDRIIRSPAWKDETGVLRRALIRSRSTDFRIQLVLEVDTVVQMELLRRPVEHWNGYSLEGFAPFLGYGGDGVSSYKRKWDADGLKHIQKYGKKFKREQGQRQRYDTPSLKDLPRKKRNPFPRSRRSRRSRMEVPRTVPRAPFNDSSFLMKVRRAGGLEALVSPSPATSSRAAYHREDEGMVVEPPVAEPLGVGDGYGSMTGLIHLRAATADDGVSSSTTVDESSDIDCMPQQEEESSSLLSELDSVRKLEQRLDRDVSRFEMTLPSLSSEDNHNGAAESLEERVVRRDRDIAFLEDENLRLKERLFLMQQEVNEYQKRLLAARGGSHHDKEEVGELSVASGAQMWEQSGYGVYPTHRFQEQSGCGVHLLSLISCLFMTQSVGLDACMVGSDLANLVLCFTTWILGYLQLPGLPMTLSGLWPLIFAAMTPEACEALAWRTKWV
ncbi:unnamed protein product [Sphagnum troendelagicum]